MQRLWSPWRSKYVESLQQPKDGCEFCRVNKLDDDENSFVVLRKKYNYIVMNIYPYNSGHLLVVPYEHVDDITVLSDETLAETMKLIQYCLKVLKNVFSAEGFNVGLNIGSVAGAGISEHVHFHVVPRWKGDTNFLPVLGKTKVISQDLKSSYKKIQTEFKKILSPDLQNS